VFKLVTGNTVDAKILELGKEKSSVNSALLDEGAEGEGSKGETQSMSRMLKDALRSFLA